VTNRLSSSYVPEVQAQVEFGARRKCVYIQKNSVEKQTGMWSAVTRPPCRLLSPSNILPPSSSHSAVIPARKYSTHISKKLFPGFTFYKIV